MDSGPEAPADESPPSTAAVAGWFDRLLWLGPHVARARLGTFVPGQAGFDLYDIARQVCDEAARLRRAGRGTWVVLGLDCIAVELLVRVHLARAGQSAAAGLLGEADWASVQQLPTLEAAWREFSSVHLARLMAVLGADRVATLTRLSDDEREAFARHVHALVQRLLAPLDLAAHRLGWVLFARWSRVVTFAVLLAVTMVYSVDWVLSRLHPNLAFRRPVSASSTNDWAPDPNKLTDGIIDVMGVHTNGGDQQWVLIDLGDVKEFDKIVVYNRPDCCAERAVPLKVEVSNDNRDFRQIAERVEVFDKWTAGHLQAEGRYVRLKNTPPSFFHLAEVEIY